MNKPYLLIIVLVVIGLLATKRFFDQRRQNEINDNSTQISYLVTVEDKKDYPYPNMRSRERDVVSPETFRYEVYFKSLNAGITSEDKPLKIILKDEQAYRAINKGSRGRLYLQGTRFIRFEPEN